MDNNVKNEVLEVINSIPENANSLEKVRWVYIKLGKIFSFDLKSFDSKKNISLDSDYIDRQQTCVQISVLLNEILNKIDPNIKCEIIERKMENHRYEQEHLANVITYNNNGVEEKYMLDLTLDLFRIHFDLKTLEFGYCGYSNMDLDIMSLREDAKMDEKLGLYPNGYTDDKLKEVKTELSFVDFSNMTFEEEIEYRLLKARPFLRMNDTYPETNEFFFKYIIDYMLSCHTTRGIIRNGNQQKYVYIFQRRNETVWYILDEDNRFYKTSLEDVEYMLDNGWVNNKGIIYEFIAQSTKKL